MYLIKWPLSLKILNFCHSSLIWTLRVGVWDLPEIFNKFVTINVSMSQNMTELMFTGSRALRESPGGGEPLRPPLHGGDGIRLRPVAGRGAEEDRLPQTGLTLHQQTSGHHHQWEVSHGPSLLLRRWSMCLLKQVEQIFFFFLFVVSLAVYLRLSGWKHL